MAVTSGFFNSLNHDRTYDAEQFSQQFDGLITEGVFDSIGNRFMVRASAGMSVIVGSGRAWFNHTWTYNDADLTLVIDPSSIGADRIDAIVLKVDHSETIRANSIEIVKGNPGEGKPELIDTDEVFYHPLAYITIKSGTTEITPSDIENAVGTSLTPFVTGLLEHVSVDELLVQWQDQFNKIFFDWFDHLHNELDEHQAANLQRQIDDSIEKQFEYYHNMCNENSTYIKDDIGEIVRIESSNEDGDITSVITFDDSDGVLTIVEVVTTPIYIYTSTTEYDGSTSTTTYTRGGNVSDG